MRCFLPELTAIREFYHGADAPLCLIFFAISSFAQISISEDMLGIEKIFVFTKGSIHICSSIFILTNPQLISNLFFSNIITSRVLCSWKSFTFFKVCASTTTAVLIVCSIVTACWNFFTWNPFLFCHVYLPSLVCAGVEKLIQRKLKILYKKF